MGDRANMCELHRTEQNPWRAERSGEDVLDLQTIVVSSRFEELINDRDFAHHKRHRNALLANLLLQLIN